MENIHVIENTTLFAQECAKWGLNPNQTSSAQLRAAQNGVPNSLDPNDAYAGLRNTPVPTYFEFWSGENFQ